MKSKAICNTIYKCPLQPNNHQLIKIYQFAFGGLKALESFVEHQDQWSFTWRIKLNTISYLLEQKNIKNSI